MKRFVLMLMMSLAAAGLWAQDLAVFQDGFETFATDMAATLSYNATIGNNWSDAYIGGFPHFGAGISVGATTVPADSLDALFDSMGIAVPSSINSMGLPIPAAAVSVKLGGFVLPFDVGVKAMVLPAAATEALSAADISADYKLLGGNLRFALLKQNILMPDVSVGLGYNRLTGSISMPIGDGSESFTFNDGTDDYVFTAGTPKLAMDWMTDSFDLTIQISKSLLFFRPYAGAGYSFGKSVVNGGVSADMELTYGGVTQTDYEQVKADLAAAGVDISDLSADGFMFESENNDPVLRLYGGLSVDLFILMLDTQVTWVPGTGSLGGTATIRIQL
ncbi:MAG: hypothetical protein RBT68_06185 [Spirochaetia bacterium]|jgi:hypothetical protein|nr:hypothetical protein [Spirochaetia bacterium]